MERDKTGLWVSLWASWLSAEELQEQEQEEHDEDPDSDLEDDELLGGLDLISDSLVLRSFRLLKTFPNIEALFFSD